MDEILLEGMRFFGYHGVNPEERSLGQRFDIDVAIEANLREAGRSDDLEQTISYSAVFKRVRAVVEGQRFALLEALGEAVCEAVLAGFPPAERVVVTIRKPNVAIKGAILDSAGVRIRRSRTGVGQ